MGDLATNASLTIVIEEVIITKEMYGWSKYGGGRHGLVKTDDSVWYCQCCGKKQPRELPGYMFSIGNREYLRLCSSCWAIINEGFSFEEVKKMVRKEFHIGLITPKEYL